MTHARRRLRTIAACAWLAASGCTTLREIPRAEYAAKGERKGVVVETREGLEYRFDYARFESDSLVGYRLADTEGTFEESHRLPIAFEAVEKLSARRVDWLRTGLIGGGAIAALVVTAGRRLGAGAGTEPSPEPPPVP